jgi:predicted nucleic acid-binding protein
MPSDVFLDTNGWIALLHSKDSSHASAKRVWLDIGRDGRRVILTDWIIAETGNGLARSGARHQFAEVVARFWNSPLVEIVVVDRILIERAIDRYCQYADKTWGLVDCASFVVMQGRDIGEAFTSDQHFEQAGFKRLLVSP